MNTNCRFPCCCWYGPVNQLYNHCMVYHQKNIKLISNENTYQFNANDLIEQIYLLCRQEGLYWFTLDNQKINFSNTIRRGIVAIGDSSTCTYTMSLTIPGTQLAYCNPQNTATNSDQYDLEINFDKMPNIYPYFDALQMTIKFQTNHQPQIFNESAILDDILDMQEDEEQRRTNGTSNGYSHQSQGYPQCNLCSKQGWNQPNCPLCFDLFANIDPRYKKVSEQKAINAIGNYLMN